MVVVLSCFRVSMANPKNPNWLIAPLPQMKTPKTCQIEGNSVAFCRSAGGNSANAPLGHFPSTHDTWCYVQNQHFDLLVETTFWHMLVTIIQSVDLNMIVFKIFTNYSHNTTIMFAIVGIARRKWTHHVVKTSQPGIHPHIAGDLLPDGTCKDLSEILHRFSKQLVWLCFFCVCPCFLVTIAPRQPAILQGESKTSRLVHCVYLKACYFPELYLGARWRSEVCLRSPFLFPQPTKRP